jgi:hypothetical protein
MMIKMHPFFKEIDFDKIANQSFEKPNDTEVVQCVLTDETPVNSIEND